MKKTLNRIIKDNIAKNTKVVVAFSGGPDSVYLLYKLNELNHCKIILAHLNHKLRGKDSDKDEEFSVKAAERFNLQIETDSFDIKNYAKKNSLNLEEACRIKRYEFLRKVKNKYNAEFIITAHHANDNLETFLLNFLRGTGFEGLKSIKLLNNDILRPLLYTSKKEILEFLDNNKIKYRTDKSNYDITIKRNKLRNDIIPELEKIQPELIKIFNRNITNINEIHKIIDSQAKEFIKNKIKYSELNNLNDAFIKQIIIKIYESLYGSTLNLNSNLINRSLKLIKNQKTGKKTEFGKSYYLITTSDSIQIKSKNQNNKIAKKKLKIPGKTKFEFGEIICEIKKNPPENGIYFDYSKLYFPLYLREKLNGDRFKPLGLKGTKKLQDYFVDRKIPKDERTQIPIIIDKNDKIIAVGDIIIDDNYKISESNKKKDNQYLEIHLKKDKL
jgi:tRNA(Ile)-lysidine synthase